MKLSATTILMAAALGVSAHPSGHAHRRAHRSLEARHEFVYAKKPVEAQPQSTSVVPPPAASTPAYSPPPPAAKPSSKPAPAPQPPHANGSGSGSGPSSYVDFCGGPSKRATAEEIAYEGNVGASGKYGCNMMLVQDSIADKYDYSAVFVNKASSEQFCACWMKIGSDGGIDGFFKGKEALTFTLPVGGRQSLAVDTNTQGGCACNHGSVSTTSFGQYADTWVEFDFGNLSNNGWSGADASCLVAAANHLEIPGLQVCHSDTCSTIYPGGSGVNAYLGGMAAMDGVGLNIPPGKASITVNVGYQG